jgi:hypothetical protein
MSRQTQHGSSINNARFSYAPRPTLSAGAGGLATDPMKARLHEKLAEHDAFGRIADQSKQLADHLHDLSESTDVLLTGGRGQQASSQITGKFAKPPSSIQLLKMLSRTGKTCFEPSILQQVTTPQTTHSSYSVSLHLSQPLWPQKPVPQNLSQQKTTLSSLTDSFEYQHTPQHQPMISTIEALHAHLLLFSAASPQI